METGLPLLVVPAGTFNHFAADLGVERARDALAALRDGEAVAVDLALAGSRPFVDTSSTGVYVDMVNARRQLEGVLGRRLAEVVALIGVLRHSRPHELVLDGRCRRIWLYFAGNCRYEPQGMAPAYRPDLADGWLDIRVVEAAVLARAGGPSGPVPVRILLPKGATGALPAAAGLAGRAPERGVLDRFLAALRGGSQAWCSPASQASARRRRCPLFQEAPMPPLTVPAGGRGADRYARPLPGVPLVARQIHRRPGGGRPAHLAVHRRRGGHRRIRVHPWQAPAPTGGLPETGTITYGRCGRTARCCPRW